jgi:L,D-transpeptidase YcbB
MELGRARGAKEAWEVLREVANAGDARRALEDLEPPFAAYQRTLQALQRYRRLAREGAPEPLPVPARPVERGEHYLAAPRLATFLLRVGDLRGTEDLERDETIYGAALVEAVRRFQARHGLEPDGRLGARTLRELNTPLSRRVTQLELTLERWRWAPRGLTAPRIVVNVPEYRLRAIDAAGASDLSMKVVVGRAYRHRTPVFAAEMTHVLFRPSWSVPIGIQRDELLPRIAKDPRFLEREEYEIVDRYGNAARVGHPAEALEGLRAGVLRLRQRPGPRNSLGLVKFVFPNEHEVYLHGTPAQALFARSRRDFSHGCIRVEDPVALAQFVLRDQAAWTPDAIRAAMDGPQPRRVDLIRPIPVLIVYGTAVVSEDGEVRFLHDVYGLDAALERALAERRPYQD